MRKDPIDILIVLAIVVAIILAVIISMIPFDDADAQQHGNSDFPQCARNTRQVLVVQNQLDSTLYNFAPNGTFLNTVRVRTVFTADTVCGPSVNQLHWQKDSAEARSDAR